MAVILRPPYSYTNQLREYLMQAAEIFSVSSEWLIENLLSLGVAIIILVAGVIFAGFAARAVVRQLSRKEGSDTTVAPILSQFVRYAVITVAIILALTQIGVETASLLAVIGAAGLAIALALQGTLSNIASGVMLIWLRPLSTGEYIDSDNVSGTVVEIGLFATRLQAADGVYVFAPNSQIWNARITNYSREPRRRVTVNVGIAYDADIAKARKVLLKIAKDDRVLPDPEPAVMVDSLGESSVNMMLRCWVATPDYWAVLWEFTEKTKTEFDKAGIEIPFNKLDLNIKQAPEGAA